MAVVGREVRGAEGVTVGSGNQVDHLVWNAFGLKQYMQDYTVPR